MTKFKWPDNEEPTMNYELNESTIRKVLSTVDAGLTEGMGKPIPGRGTWR